MSIPTNNRRESFIDRKFPNICCNYEILGDANVGYNCVAYAMDDLTRVWWPNSYYYWPPDIKMMEDIDSFIQCFKANGYDECGLDEKYENGYEKVAIYVNEEYIPTHVSKQSIGDNGCWRSKLGSQSLIKHTLGGLSGLFNGESYGNVAIILKRKAQIITTPHIFQPI